MEAVEIVALPGRGSGLIATRDIERDEVVLVSRPEVSVLYSDFALSHCALCYTTVDSEEGCSRCTKCSSFTLCRTCNNEGACEWHAQGECAAFMSINPGMRRGDTDYLRWFLRFFDLLRRGTMPSSAEGAGSGVETFVEDERGSRSISGNDNSNRDSGGGGSGGGMGGADSDTSRFAVGEHSGCEVSPSPPAEASDPFSSLVSLEAEQTAETLAWTRNFAGLFMAHAAPPPGMTTDRVAEILLRIKVNALGFPFRPDATLGWSLDTRAALFNHSCAPNCAVEVGPRGELIVRVTRKVPWQLKPTGK